MTEPSLSLLSESKCMSGEAICLDRVLERLLAIGASGGGGFLPFPHLETDQSRTVSGRLHHSLENPG